MRWHEIAGPDPDAAADARFQDVLTPREYAAATRPGLTPSERERMYHPEAEDEELELQERRAKIDKINADVRKINAEADRAEAEAEAHRAVIKRAS